MSSPAGSLLARFLGRIMSRRAGCDVTLAWQGYGNHRQVDAVLQAQTPGLVRLSVNDPLGRPLLLLVIDGRRFNPGGRVAGAGRPSARWIPPSGTSTCGRGPGPGPFCLAHPAGCRAGPMQVIEVLPLHGKTADILVCPRLWRRASATGSASYSAAAAAPRPPAARCQGGRVVLDVIYTYGQDRDGACPRAPSPWRPPAVT
ncbi:hypothetical protein ACLG6S_15170 [Thermodesulfobacteriota bacterium B35]